MPPSVRDLPKVRPSVDSRTGPAPSVVEPSGRLARGGAFLAGASVWILLFGLRLRRVPVDWWRWRDDAVITLSAALNLARFGSIGPSPGGGRVEDFSSPLQFLLASTVFSVRATSYQAFLDCSVAIAVAVSGGLTASLLHATFERAPKPPRHPLAAAVVLTALAASSILFSWTATGWLVSGMENSLILLLGATIAYLAVRSSTRTGSIVVLAVALAAFGATRTEFPLFMGPLLAAVGYRTWQDTIPARRRVALLVVVGAPVTFWGVLVLGGYAYFGHLLPNSAIVEGKSFGPFDALLLGVLSVGAVGFALVGVLGVLGPTVKRWTWITVGLLSVLAFAVLAVLSGTATSPTPNGYRDLLVVPVLTGSLAVAMVGLTRRSAGAWTPDLVFTGLVFIPFAQFALMGSARLDPYRILSLSVPFVSLWVAATLARLMSVSRQREGVPVRRNRSAQALTVVGMCALVCAGLAWAAPGFKARNLCCDVSAVDGGKVPQILDTANSLQKAELGGRALPIVANPDLGKISFAKEAVIEDLGWLGDPLLARIQLSRPDLVDVYLNDIADPDVVATHASWSCIYASWIRSPQFRSTYAVVNSWPGDPAEAACPLDGRSAIWRRSGPAGEYLLTRSISRSSRPADVVAAAISSCRGASGGVFRCEYVRRAVLRNAQMLIDRGRLDAVLAALRASPSAGVDVPLISQEPGWDTAAFAAFVRLAR